MLHVIIYFVIFAVDGAFVLAQIEYTVWYMNVRTVIFDYYKFWLKLRRKMAYPSLAYASGFHFKFMARKIQVRKGPICYVYHIWTTWKWAKI